MLIRSFAPITQMAQDKWANVSDLTRLLRTNERLWANRSGCSYKMSKYEQFARYFEFEKIVFLYILTFLCEVFKNAKDLLIPSEQSEQIAQVAQVKWVTVSDRSGRSPKMSEWANHPLFEQIAHLLTFLANNERFASKLDEQISNPEIHHFVSKKRQNTEKKLAEEVCFKTQQDL